MVKQGAKQAILLMLITAACTNTNRNKNNDMQNFTVTKTITINAPAAKVWQALTDPDITKEYFFGCKVYSDWKAGSPITFKGKIFLLFDIEMKGEILAIEPQKLLKYTLANSSDKSGTFSTVTDELRQQNGTTILTITDDVGDGKDAKERYDKSVKGWDKVLNGLKEYVEHHQ